MKAKGLPVWKSWSVSSGQDGDVGNMALRTCHNHIKINN